MMIGEKLFIGPKLRELRQAQKMTQAEMGTAIGVSASYINLLERNQRSASLKVLVTLSDRFAIDWKALTNSDSGLALADLRALSRDPAFGDHQPDIEELRAAIEHAPNLVKGVFNIFEVYRAYGERLMTQNELLSSVNLEGTEAASGSAKEQSVHDFFRASRNYFPVLEARAERLMSQGTLEKEEYYGFLKDYLDKHHGVEVRPVSANALEQSLRFIDRQNRRVLLSDGLDYTNKVFQLAHTICLIEYYHEINTIIEDGGIDDERIKARCRVELCNYFASAVMMPYDAFHSEAVAARYDIEHLSAKFAASYEQVCHRLTTLQKPSAKGIPFFFLRVDRAGNVSKRFNATTMQLARYGGACPRLDVHYCFRVPGRIISQIVEMPDNSRYFTINRTVDRPTFRYSNEDKRLALSLGCPVEHANETIYSAGFDLQSRSTVTEVGVNCRLCPRHHCEHRAHEPFFQNLKLDEDRRGITRFES